MSFRYRPEQGTPLKNQTRGEHDISLKPHVAEIIEDYLGSPHRYDVSDEYGRVPLITTKQGRPAPTTYRNWMYRWTQPYRLGEECPEGREPDECPVSLSPHPIRAE